MLHKLADLILNYWRKSRHRKKKIRFLANSYLDARTEMEGYNSIGVNNRIFNCYLGIGTYTGRNVELASVKIGRFCSIGSFIRNTGGRHPVNVFVSSHPAFFSKGKAAGFTFSEEQKFEEIKHAQYPYLVTIGNDVWIGDNVTILDGIIIGDGAVIGANSLVTKDIEPYTINRGVPAQKVGHRFDEEVVKFLLDFKWWDRDFKWIEDNHHYFSDIELFMKEIKATKNQGI
jgi:acetyltransferase-like isoleucine patch superfamily enzyme